jgi:flavin reductase (DIM6/NTAB) family NADH-FMN oxidoreductase RutF
MSPRPLPAAFHQLPDLDPETFRSVLGRFASGVTVLTTRSDDTDVGMTVSAFCSLSLQPPLVLSCIAKTADLHHVLPNGQHVVFNVLSATQEALSRRFAEEEGSRRFDGIGFHRDRNGVAILDDVLASIEATIVEQYDGGDHSIFVAHVDGASSSDARPLLYYRGGYAELER